MLSELVNSSLEEVQQSVDALWERLGIDSSSLTEKFSEFATDGERNLRLDNANLRDGVQGTQNITTNELSDGNTPENQDKKRERAFNNVNQAIAIQNLIDTSIKNVKINSSGFITNAQGEMLTRAEVSAIEEENQICLGGAVQEEIISAQNEVLQLQDFKLQIENGLPLTEQNIPQSVKDQLNKNGITSPTNTDYIAAADQSILEIQWQNGLDSETNEYVPLVDRNISDLLPPINQDKLITTAPISEPIATATPQPQPQPPINAFQPS